MAKPHTSRQTDTGSKATDWLVDRFARILLGLVMLLPYGTRVRFMGWFTSRIVAPLAGYNKRIRANLAHVMPELAKEDAARLCREVPDNIGRSLIEMYSGQQFVDHVADLPLTGPGAEAARKAHDDKRPVIGVTGHFGNYEVLRAVLVSRGYPVGALYKPMKNAFFNAHYEEMLKTIGQPVFPRGRRGYSALLRHLRQGNMVAFLIDQYMGHGAALDFFGKPAPTALSAAELALKHEAMLVPIYAVRESDGLNFRIVVNEPIPHTDAETMTQALNHDLERMVRAHMGQWFWIHRRWKPERQARFAARRARRDAVQKNR